MDVSILSSSFPDMETGSDHERVLGFKKEGMGKDREAFVKRIDLVSMNEYSAHHSTRIY